MKTGTLLILSAAAAGIYAIRQRTTSTPASSSASYIEATTGPITDGGAIRADGFFPGIPGGSPGPVNIQDIGPLLSDQLKKNPVRSAAVIAGAVLLVVNYKAIARAFR